MSRRTWNVVAAGLLALALGVLGATLPVPLVALGPGPTYDTLGDYDGAPIVQVDGLPTYPTGGHLNMTTVSVVDRLTLFGTVGFWAAGDHQVVPRSQVYPPDKSDEQVQQENTAAFSASEADAESAALTYLDLPVKVVVAGLTPGSPSAGTLEVGDELVAVAGTPTPTPSSVSETLRDSRPGQSVPVVYRRGGEQREGQIVLGASPDRPQGLLGVLPGIAPGTGDIRISLGEIGGPSAGLMFALAVVDRLTPGELAGDGFVAGTGTITPGGAVGAIGGIPFKMRKASEVGAAVFLVPADNCAEALATAPDGLRLVRVGSLTEAVAALDALRAGAAAPTC